MFKRSRFYVPPSCHDIVSRAIHPHFDINTRSNEVDLMCPPHATNSSILKQWGIWPPKGSNLQGFGPPPPPPGPSVCPPKTCQKSVQNYGAKMDRSSGTNWTSGPVFSEKKTAAAGSKFGNIDFHFCENPYSKLTNMGGAGRVIFWGQN